MKKTQPSIILILLFLVLLFGLLGWRLFHLQYCQAQNARLHSHDQLHAVVPVSPQRGAIMDCRGRILADVQEKYILFADRNSFPGPDMLKEAAWQLQPILDIPSHEICAAIYGGLTPGYIKLKEGITTDQRDEIQACNLHGIGIQTDWERIYPCGALTSHVVGYVGYLEDKREGVAGLELKYNSLLEGREGKEVYVVDSRRRPIGMALDDSRDVHNGAGLVLTIDATIQQFVRQALLKQMQKYQAESAVGIVMDPRSGEILALVSLPDFAPSEYSSYVEDKKLPLKNRALCDPYEPGSIFKPIAVAIALDAGSIRSNDVFYCENGYFTQYKIGEFLNHPYGNLSVKQILAKSSNVGMAKIGLKIGQKRLYDGVRLFGFGEKTGIDLPGEDAGVVWPTNVWDKYTVTRIPFGHALTVTTIQIIRAYCIIANDGHPVIPHLVKAMIDEKGQVFPVPPDPGFVAQVIKQETAKWLRETALVEVIKNGTGDQAKIAGIQTWGKTGTANIARPREQGGGYDEKNYIASFVGGAPAEKPELVVLVSIRKPNRSLGIGYSGGRVAAPVFREIMENTLKYMHGGQLPEKAVASKAADMPDS
ncbi:MAG: penicillin-binding protein 2 [Sedimentisphaerales bacterium]|nr:penicillin-binding protein 2 [Sedimentisphaerales bacterium]